MSEPIPAYPLQWPPGWRRARSPRWSRYRVTFAKARDDLRKSLRLLPGTGVVISSNVELRRDGFPYANFSEPRDRGVAVYWNDKEKRPWCVACDQWDKVKDNLRAIGLTVNALRMIQRTGATELLERAYTGFTALPAETLDWRSVLGLGDDPTRKEVDSAYRRRALETHPDSGGSHEGMVSLNRARDVALEECGRGWNE